MTIDTEIRISPFEDLSPREAYAVWRLRQDVFIVEQHCPYADLDGRDLEPGTAHVLLLAEDELIGYARVLADPEAWRIGRVLLAERARGQGLADQIMRAAVAHTARDPDRVVNLAAQSPLAGWYASFGFVVAGPAFLEDGIRHTPMVLRRAG